MNDDIRDMLPPTARAQAYLLDYRPEGATVLPSEQLRLAELVHAGWSPADAAEQVQAETAPAES